MELVLPDKDGGSILPTSSPITRVDAPQSSIGIYKNEWIVALYMGINKDSSIESSTTSIYWATGNLIATKQQGRNLVRLLLRLLLFI